ncbi:methyl-accepting chemotaxis protein [Cellulomonas citrea]|uniref:methyl-accepting chemotaxis protein n=1 Tax=Cellulomonas citrea TaxID=1909423 RepID=UPI00135903BD|nr:methyl-accepting chemotaxis protein [Cellulomonas citrea]
MRRRTRPAEDVAAPSVQVTEDQLDLVIQVLTAVSQGDLEPRLTAIDCGPKVEQARLLVNRLLDVVDAFVRESAVSLTEAAQGRFHRTLLERGLPGAFRQAAGSIGSAHGALAAAQRDLLEQSRTRQQIVERAIEVSGHVAAASTELGASAEGLAQGARSGVAEADEALAIVRRLEESSARIEEAVALIRHIAGRTRMLALNATIEAARAGEAGRGFAVVAGEVKNLADGATASSEDIVGAVATVQRAAQDAGEAMAAVVMAIHSMEAEVAAIATAAGDGDGGLSRMAEVLSAEIGQFAELS